VRLLLFNLATDADDPILGFTTRWITALAERVEQIDVVTMRVGRVDVPDNVRVYSVGKEKGYSEPRRVIEFYRILGQLLASKHYDACFAHMMPLFVVMASPLLRLKNIPVVLWYTHKSVTWMLRFATFSVERVVTASQESFRIPSRKVRVIGHGIDTEQFIPRKDSSSFHQPFTILTVGRLSPIKRVDLLIKAVALLHEQKPEFSLCLIIVGEPLIDSDRAYQAKLKELVKQYNLQDVVIFAGSVSNQEVITFYQKASCFVNMSETGSVDKAVLEAMSCAVPVVANPIFSDVIGEDLAREWIVNWDAKELCDRLLLLTSISEQELYEIGRKLRSIVVKNHGLYKLCTKILCELKEINL
jgi:glycosyltransferase involved in cell wall biosynthesis